MTPRWRNHLFCARSAEKWGWEQKKRKTQQFEPCILGSAWRNLGVLTSTLVRFNLQSFIHKICFFLGGVRRSCWALPRRTWASQIPWISHFLLPKNPKFSSFWSSSTQNFPFFGPQAPQISLLFWSSSTPNLLVFHPQESWISHFLVPNHPEFPVWCFQ